MREDTHHGICGAETFPEYHHIWPKKYCTEHLSGWTIQDSPELALNIMPVYFETNNKWHKMNPADQINDIKTNNNSSKKIDENMKKLYLSNSCIDSLKKQNKERQDYLDFIDARFEELVLRLKDWDFTVSTSNEQ